MQTKLARAAAAVLAATSIVGVAACGSSKKKSSSTPSSSAPSTSAPATSTPKSSGGKTIAFLLPENQTARYESQDKPLFEADVKKLCPSCSVLYSNATQDASKQQSQAEAALAQGVSVLVLDPVDGAAAATIVNEANAKHVPVISYDRLILNSKPNYYVEFNSPSVGKIQATALVNKLHTTGKTSGNIVMINGSPTDNNAKLFKQGAHSVLDHSGFKIAKEYDTPDWAPATAQTEMDQAISALGKTGFIGVYAANDGTGGGAIAAMKGAGIDPKTRPTTGQDAELAAIQRILTGDQYMTVYKPIKPLAATAAHWAVDLALGHPVKGANATENNGKTNVPTKKLAVIAVFASNVKSTIVKDGFWTASQICTSAYAAACTKAGIK
jgi:D-xylose transport system substrate-binding protein